MHDYQSAFIELAIELDVLRFGSFTLKSGRESPYFFNAGRFSTGRAAAAVGRAYAAAIVNSGVEFDMLFGPAYKGIPLVALPASAIMLNNRYGKNIPYAYNRKEAKDHGEGGSLVGAPLAGRVLVIDDVMTAGTAIREAYDIIRQAGAEFGGVAIALDRQERGTNEESAVQQVEKDYDCRVISIVRLADLIDHLASSDGDAGTLAAIRAYRQNYGT